MKISSFWLWLMVIVGIICTLYAILVLALNRSFTMILFQKDNVPDDFFIATADDMPLIHINDEISIDRYEINNGQYARCVKASFCTAPQSAQWKGYSGDRKYKNLPVTNVTRHQAETYCGWAGRRLPENGEWENAAQNAESGTEFPWGNDFLAQNLNFSESMVYGSTAVQDYSWGATQDGLVQMLGNVWEWVSDPDAAEGTSLSRGGSWNSYRDGLSPASVFETSEAYVADNIGFRCAADNSAINKTAFRQPLFRDYAAELIIPRVVSLQRIIPDAFSRIFTKPSVWMASLKSTGQTDEESEK